MEDVIEKGEWPKSSFFSIRVFFYRHSQYSREREGTIFYSTLPLPPAHEHLDTYFQLCMWDDYHVFFYRTASIYQTATRWDLPPYWITIWLIDDAMSIFVCLLNDLILGFCYSNLTWEACINYHPCITSEPTNQVG